MTPAARLDNSIDSADNGRLVAWSISVHVSLIAPTPHHSTMLLLLLLLSLLIQLIITVTVSYSRREQLEI